MPLPNLARKGGVYLGIMLFIIPLSVSFGPFSVWSAGSALVWGEFATATSPINLPSSSGSQKTGTSCLVALVLYISSIFGGYCGFATVLPQSI